MKALINTDFKAIRTGDFVEASDNCDEFIFDSENNSLMPIQLLEIASSNKISLDKKLSLKDMATNLGTSLLNLNLPEQNEMSNTEKVLEIVLEGFEKGFSDDEMLVSVVKAGIPFRNAAKMFRVCVEENGLRLSSKKRAESIESILEDNEFYPETFAEVTAMSERIAVGNKEKDLTPVADTTTTQAIKAIKKFLKEKEIEFPKAPKKAKGGLRDRYLDFSLANPAATDADLSAWYKENTNDKSDEDVQKWADRYLIFVNYGRAMAKACIDGEILPCDVTVVKAEAEAESEETGTETEA